MSEEQKNVSFSNTINVVVNDRTIAVKKLGLIKYSQICGSLQDLISSIFKFTNYKNTLDIDREDLYGDIGSMIAELVKTNVVQIIKFLDVAIPDLGYEYICNEVGLDDLLLLVEAILKVNNINKVISDTKKLIQDLPL